MAEEDDLAAFAIGGDDDDDDDLLGLGTAGNDVDANDAAVGGLSSGAFTDDALDAIFGDDDDDDGNASGEEGTAGASDAVIDDAAFNLEGLDLVDGSGDADLDALGDLFELDDSDEDLEGGSLAVGFTPDHTAAETPSVAQSGGAASGGTDTPASGSGVGAASDDVTSQAAAAAASATQNPATNAPLDLGPPPVLSLDVDRSVFTTVVRDAEATLGAELASDFPGTARCCAAWCGTMCRRCAA